MSYLKTLIMQRSISASPSRRRCGALVLTLLLCLSAFPARAARYAAPADTLPATPENLVGTWGFRTDELTIGVRLSSDSSAMFSIVVSDEEELQGMVRIQLPAQWSTDGETLSLTADLSQLTAKYEGNNAELGEQIQDIFGQMMKEKLADELGGDTQKTKTLTISSLTADKLVLADDDGELLTLQRAVARP